MKLLRLSFLVVAVLLCGCNHIDIKPGDHTHRPTDGEDGAADSPEAPADPAMLFGAVHDMVSLMSEYNQLGGGEHTDYGMASWMLWTDMRGMDMYSSGTSYDWYVNAMQLNDSQYVSMPWTYCYNLIAAANRLLNSIGADTSDAAQFAGAQAHAFRAFGYFTLAQIFQFTYRGHEEQPCVPIVSNGDSDGQPKATVAEVYNQVMADLDAAIGTLEKTEKLAMQAEPTCPKRLVSLATAYGLRARVELVMCRWENAAADAQAAIATFSGAPKSIAEASKPSFTSLDESDWMWGIAIDEGDRAVRSGYANFPSHMGSLCGGYATEGGAFKWVSRTLYDQIAATDCRRGWFLDSDGLSVNLTADQQAYVSNHTAGWGSMAERIQVKFGAYQGVTGQTVNASDIPLMRIEEMYLILAEAQGMTDNARGARTLADFVRTYRDPAYEVNAADIADAVWLQRRIELWGEGFSYYDMLRLGKDLDRRDGGWPEPYGFHISAEDPALVFSF